MIDRNAFPQIARPTEHLEIARFMPPAPGERDNVVKFQFGLLTANRAAALCGISDSLEIGRSDSAQTAFYAGSPIGSTGIPIAFLTNENSQSCSRFLGVSLPAVTIVFPHFFWVCRSPLTPIFTMSIRIGGNPTSIIFSSLFNVFCTRYAVILIFSFRVRPVPTSRSFGLRLTPFRIGGFSPVVIMMPKTFAFPAFSGCNITFS